MAMKKIKMLTTVAITAGLLTLSTATAFGIDKSTALTTGVAATNNVGKTDTVKVTGLTAKDIIMIYDSATGGTLLGKGTVPADKTEVTISIPQIGVDATDIYVSRTSDKKSESDTLKYTAPAEAVTTAPDKANITVKNNYGTSDTVKVTGLAEKDVVFVYDLSAGGNLLGKATVPAAKTEATVSIKQIGAAGQVYVSVLSVNKLESTRTAPDAVVEAKTAKLTSGVTVTNNVTSADTVKVTGLAEKDVVFVYDSATGGNLLGKATVAATKTEATVTIKQIGNNGADIYVTVKSIDKAESDRYKVTAAAATTSTAPDKTKITVTNNSDATTSDTVKVTGLTEKDTVLVYDSATGGYLLGKAVVAAGKTEATVTIKEIGDSGQVYVANLTPNCLVSTRTAPDAVAEVATANLTSLVISGSPSNYTFAGGTYTYSGVTVPNGVASVTITPTGSGTIKVNGATVASGAASAAIALTAGAEKTITVVATETGKSSKTYTIKITRQQPVAAAGTATATTGTKTIVYVLSTGTFDATNGILKANWTFAGTNIADLGAITGIALSNSNKTATITVTNDIGASGKNYTVAPKVAALSAGFTAPAAATVTISAALSSAKAITATTVGTLSSGNIIDVPASTKVSALKAALTVSAGATVEVLDGTGGTAVADQTNTDVTATMVIEVTAEDGSTAEYTIAMAP